MRRQSWNAGTTNSWQDRLADSPTYLRDNCWTMIKSVVVTLPPDSQSDTQIEMKWWAFNPPSK